MIGGPRGGSHPQSLEQWQLSPDLRASRPQLCPKGGRPSPATASYQAVNVKATDRSVRYAIECETLEETGLVFESILGEFEELYWDSRGGKKNVRFSNAVGVKPDMPVIVIVNEHCNWAWVREEQTGSLWMAPAMNKVLKDAFVSARKFVIL
ncbi:hypothetical protein BBP40_012775 [Aspergillus hancockii]|nr:hypothetical protein BBP40_012775 [Aspergillus hancockii]